MNILAALGDAQPTTPRRCRIGRWLDSIPAETEGRDDLAATLTCTSTGSPHYRTINEILCILYALGLPTSARTIQEHRRGSRRCAG